MARKRKVQTPSTADILTVGLPPLLRVAGRERSAQQVVANATQGTIAIPGVQFRMGAIDHEGASADQQSDYAQIDPALAVQPAPILSEPPSPGTGYSGFTPIQRHHFLHWATQSQSAAPPAFRRLYIAQLEVSLFDATDKSVAAHQELLHLADAPAWQQELALWRALLLSFWCRQNGAELSQWLMRAPTLPTALLGVAFGHLAQLGQPLLVEHVDLLLQRWHLPRLTDAAILQLRLGYLASTLEQEPLAHALATVASTGPSVEPWRCTHRQLRIAIPQPDLRPILEPLLREISTVIEPVPNADLRQESTRLEQDETAADDEQSTVTSTGKTPWRLMLEFGDSRSEFFTYVLKHAQQQAGYMQIMDENRRMVHRIHFEKRDMRRFWFLWEYVQNWSTTQVFVNGKELRKWEIYPYSPYLR